MKKNIILLGLICLAFVSNVSNAQTYNWKENKKIAILLGLNEPNLLNGFNIKANYIHNRLIFDYSYSVSFDFQDNLLPNYLKNQSVLVHMPFSVGFGIGYRFTEWLNL